MSTADPQLLLASEVIPPPEAGGQAATRLAREHQERAGAVADAHRGAVLVRVGRGCVSRFGDLDDALAALAESKEGLTRAELTEATGTFVGGHIGNTSEAARNRAGRVCRRRPGSRHIRVLR